MKYWKLILDGVLTVEACRQIGIARKTGLGGVLNRVGAAESGV